MEASAKFADASILMRKIGFVVVLLRGYLLADVFLFGAPATGDGLYSPVPCIQQLVALIELQ